MDEREKEGFKAAIRLLEKDIAEIALEYEVLTLKRNQSAEITTFFETRLCRLSKDLIKLRIKKVEAQRALDDSGDSKKF